MLYFFRMIYRLLLMSDGVAIIKQYGFKHHSVCIYLTIKALYTLLLKLICSPLT